MTEQEFEDDTLKVGSVVRYYDKKSNTHVEARIVKIQPFNEIFRDVKTHPFIEIFRDDDEGLYLYLDNDMCIHEDQCKVVFP